MTTPRTLKDAYIAEMLGDLDKIAGQLTAIQLDLNRSNEALNVNHSALERASQDYQQAVHLFTQQAQQELTAYLERKADEAASTIQSQLQAAVKTQLEEMRSTGKNWLILVILALAVTNIIALLI